MTQLPDSLFEGPPQEAFNERRDVPAPVRARHHHRRKSPASDKRLDIQGLRAVAVVAVVVNHLTNHPQGGFVGVDVFFVISGFLITGLLVRDLGPRNETLLGPVAYIWSFYKRRIRRILPAAILVIGLTLLAAHAVFSSARYSGVQKDGLWSLVFWANWHFISVLASKIGATFINTTPWYCVDNEYCPSFVGSTPMRFDTVHMTAQYSGTYITPVLHEALVSGGILPK